MDISKIIQAASGISTLFGLLTLLGYFYIHFLRNRAEKSIGSMVEGARIFNAEQILKLLSNFKNDEARLRALKELTKYDSTRAGALLNKIKSDIDISKIIQIRQHEYQKVTLVLSVFLLALGAMGLISQIKYDIPGRNGESPRKPTPANVLRLSRIKITQARQIGENEFPALPEYNYCGDTRPCIFGLYADKKPDEYELRFPLSTKPNRAWLIIDGALNEQSFPDTPQYSDPCAYLLKVFVQGQSAAESFPLCELKHQEPKHNPYPFSDWRQTGIELDAKTLWPGEIRISIRLSCEQGRRCGWIVARDVALAVE